MAQLEVGDTIPSFTLSNQNGEQVSIADYLGKGPLVIYFYPKDDTPGCTREACSFRDSYESFTDAGAQVFGVSSDSPSRHKEFAEKYRLPFELLSDTSNTVRKQFGVKGDLFGLIPGRVTFVIDSKGVVQHVFDSQTRAERHIDESLAAIERIKEDE
ncbi:MAG: peroxiredoxin [Flavobacteriia bacterium]|nr:peroxiredoxin [Flavobacteriia bacterium]